MDNAEKSLFRDLMSTYEQISRPVINANTTVTIKFGVSLNQLVDLVSFKLS